MRPVTDDQLDQRLLRLAASLPAVIATSRPGEVARRPWAGPWARATVGIVTAVLVVAGASLLVTTRPSDPPIEPGAEVSWWPSRQMVIDALTSAKGYAWLPSGTAGKLRATDPSGAVIEVWSPIGDVAAVQVTEYGDVPTSGVQELVLGVVNPGDTGWLRESYPDLGLTSAASDMTIVHHLPGGIALLEHALVDGASTWTLSLYSDDVVSVGTVEASPWPSPVDATAGPPEPSASPEGSPARAAPSAVTGLADTDWRLASVGRAAVVDAVDADIVFTEIRAGGSAGCGRFSVPYVTDLTSSLAFGPASATTGTCDGVADRLKQEYLGAFGRVAGYAIDSDGILTMSDANGAAVLTFEPTTPTSVVGHWNVTMVSDGRGGLAVAPAQLGPTLTFDPDGSIEGFDACTQLSGGYSVQGGDIAIGPVMSTVTSCGALKDDLARRYLAALDASMTWSITSGMLHLSGASGVALVEATRGY
jgi:heat shock protein HslJ